MFDKFIPMHTDVDWDTNETLVHAIEESQGPLSIASFEFIKDIHDVAESGAKKNEPDDLLVAASIMGTLRKENRLVTEPDATVFQLAACLERKSDPTLPRSMTDNDKIFSPIVSGVDVLPHMMDPVLSQQALSVARQRSDELLPCAIKELEQLCVISGRLWSDEHYTDYPGVNGIITDCVEMIKKSQCKVELVVSCPVCHVHTIVLPLDPEPIREKIMDAFQSCKCYHCGVQFNAFHPSLRLEPSERIMRIAKVVKKDETVVNDVTESIDKANLNEHDE